MDAGQISLAIILTFGGLWLIAAILVWLFRDFEWH